MEIPYAREAVTALNLCAVLVMGGLAIDAQAEAVHIQHEASTLSSEGFQHEAKSEDALARKEHGDVLTDFVVSMANFSVFASIGMPAILRKRRDSEQT